MNDLEILTAMDRAEARLAAGRNLRGCGFWAAVDHLRSDPEASRRFAVRIAQIDRAAFERGVRFRVPEAVGTSALGLGTVAAVAAIIVSGSIGDATIRTLVFLGSVGTLLITTHSLTHWIVGRMMGIRFTHYFLGGPPPPRPGAKVDYETYLQTPPKRRALMHASGAVVTKIIPFAMLLVAASLQVKTWAFYGLIVVGVVQIATDLLFSTKTSDWKKVKRELVAARGQPASSGGLDASA